MNETMPHCILVVEDNPTVAAVLRRLLTIEGHLVQTAADGCEALAAVQEAPPDLVLLDLDLPHLNGFEVCRRLKSDPTTRFIPIVILTAESGSPAKLQAWELGADDFLAKPFDCVEVAARCRSLLRVKRLLDELDSAEAVLFALARAVEAKSPYTQGHAQRVATYSVALAEATGIATAECEWLRKGALLHDIGKISVPDALLEKAGPLTAAEYDLVKQHTIQGARIVEPLHSIRHTVPMIRWHHERLDGHGYPDGLHGDQIPLLVRLLAVADVFDSLASARPYREALPPDDCVELLRADAAGGGLDPGLVETFSELVFADRLPVILPAYPAGLASRTEGRSARRLVLQEVPL